MVNQSGKVKGVAKPLPFVVPLVDDCDCDAVAGCTTCVAPSVDDGDNIAGCTTCAALTGDGCDANAGCKSCVVL